MNIEKYTDRSRGFIQSAQSLALREGHQQFAPEHILKVLLDDPEGLASGLIDRAGGRSREALMAVDTALSQLPKVSNGSCWRLRSTRRAGQEKSCSRRASRRRTSTPPSMRCARAARRTPRPPRAPMTR